MSFSLYWRPLPTNVPEPEASDVLKRAFAKRFGEHDGSCREGPWRLRVADLGWLGGVRDASGNDGAAEAKRLIACIEANPQGVEVWIGDPDDA
jgi:hypothetical protein